MVGSRFPFRDRDPNRRGDENAGNRRDDIGNRRDDIGNRRDDVGNRRDDIGNRREDGPSGSRADRADRPERVRDAGGSGQRRPRTERRSEEGGDGTNLPPAMPISGAAELAALGSEVESLIRLITATDVNELQLESGGLKIVIRRGTPAGAATSGPVLMVPAGVPTEMSAQLLAAGPAAPAAPAPVPAVPSAALPTAHGPAPASPTTLAPGEHLVTSPMVGTFYAAPAPQEPPYVAEGDSVAVGQTVGIVEAMKMMNPIEAEIGGRVARILVRDAQGVEYGQPLLVIAEG